ncbi:MAG TPA: PAS domain S-box protein, partial [Thermodesulfovibrionales bacterium]|nr:PAS domain S-box protein [Thermodesulfovibrionales bacterium]
LIVDTDGNFIEFNEAAHMHLGYTREEFAKLHIADIDSSQSPEEIQASIREVLSRGEAEFEVKHKTKGGEVRDVRVITRAMPLSGRTVFYTIWRDITEFRRANVALRESEHFLQTIIETEPECVKLLSADGTVLKMNRAGLSMVEADSPEQVIGKSVYGLVSPEYHQAFMDLNEGILQGRAGSLEFEMVGMRGRRLWLETRSVPLRNDRNEIIAILGITRDITERKKLEEQLRQAQKMEAIGQLAGGVAHDFNNILTAIMGYAGMLQIKMDENNPLKEDVEEIISSAERASQLTQNLLAFSRKQALSPKPINLNEVVANVESLLLRIIGEDIELRITISEPDLTVMADKGQIEQVLMNLCTNARDAMPDGGTLTIETGRAEVGQEHLRKHGPGKPGVYARITVSDTGEGMDEKTRERIFEPFFTTKELGKGTGLGLALVYAIVKQNEGYIDVRSEPHKGSSFVISLPIIQSEVEKAKTVGTDLPTGGPETILLAEDDRDVRRLTKEVLEKFGYKVIEAQDGEEAVTTFRQHKETVRLLVFDVVMPKKNGLEAYEEIRKIRPEIAVLFTSGYTDKVAFKPGTLAERVYFSEKPISPRKLLHKVRELLDA